MQSEIQEARSARDAAIVLVDGAADVRFRELAYCAIVEAAQTHAEFTSDDAKALCRVSFGEPRIWGALMLRAARDGLIERTERTRQSSSRVCHCREQRVWRSLVYVPQSLFEESEAA